MPTKSIEHQKAGTAVLFFIQIFSTLSYSILYSTLVLYMTNGLKLDDVQATTITASFVAFNYALHLVGGIFTGRFFSHRSLFAMGMILQAFGCYFLAQGNLYFGLAVFLSGSGLNMTCVNCMLTQFYDPHDTTRRERAFLWNYSAMNVGFLIGFTLSGFLEKFHNYNLLFLLGAISNIFTFLIVLFSWRILKDQHTIFSNSKRKKKNLFRFFGVLMIASIIISLIWLLRYSFYSNVIILISAVLMIFVIIFLALRHPDKTAAKKLWAFLILAVMAVIFWSLYMTAPMGLTLFIEHNVNRHFLGVIIQPQWALNINTVIIIIGGPLMAYLYKHLRKKAYNITIPIQFSLALFLIGLGFVVLGISIHFADKQGFTNFNWIILSYFLQSVGELCLAPIGYAMIGQLIPRKLQGIMMGTWMMTIGVGAIFANIFSKMAIGSSIKTDPLTTNPAFAKTFYMLGIGTVVAGFILLILVPFLHKLIKAKKIKAETSSIPV